MVDLTPMDATTRANYTDQEWKELAKAWRQQSPELGKFVDEVREVFGQDAKVTYIGPIREG